MEKKDKSKMKKTFSFIILTLLLTSTLTLAFNIQPARAEPEQSPTGWYWPAGTGDTGGYLGFLDWNPIFNGWHLAQDFKLDQGLPVYAIADGEVVLSRTDVGGYGRDGTPGGAIVARFETSTEEFFIALYGHIDNPYAEGKVEAGQILGYINDYDPPHLHFGIRPGYELPENPWRGYTYDESETYGWVDPVQFLLNNHPHVQTIEGIDVSHHQNDKGSIDWLEVENAGYDFAFVKATGAVSYTDPYFTANMEDASAAGLLVGAYHFAYPEYNDAVSEAQHFISVAGDYLKTGYLRPALDLEDDPAENSYPYRMGRESLSKWIHLWMDTVKSETGVEPIIYTGWYAREGDYLDASIAEYDLWIAHYTYDPTVAPDTGIWGTWDFWQYSDKGSVQGIEGNVDLNLFNGDISKLYSFLITPHAPFVPVDLVLVLDRSGSMGSSMGTKTRMQGAKDSAIAVADALMPQDRVAVVSFETTATTNVQLTSDFDLAKTEIQKISASGNTCFGAGLSLAVNELKDRGSEDHAWAIIFMSDGWHNTAPSPDPYVDECESLGIPIYTVGLGTYPSDVNEALLKQMAEETGGEYLFAPSLYELQNIFLRFSLEVTGWSLVAEFSGVVGEGETVVAGTFDVNPLTSFARVTLNWPGSDLDLTIVRPDGSEVDLGTGLDNSYSGATAKPEWVILHDPPAGTWTVKVYGKVITSPDEPYIVWISTYVPPTPHDTTPPSTSLTIGAPQHIDPTDNLYVTSATTFTLTSEDNPSGSGVASTFYRIYNGSYDTGWLEYSAPFYLTALSDGEYSIDCYGTDNIGNTEPTNTTTVILDNTAPTTTLTIGEPKYISGTNYVTPGTPFTLEAGDTGSGVSTTAYQIYSGTYNSDWLIYIGPLNLSSLTVGNYTIAFNSTDNVGNVENTNSMNVTLVGPDTNADGKVDIQDIATAARAFGSRPDHPRWNPIADINLDGQVNIRDIALIARKFGKHYS